MPLVARRRPAPVPQSMPVRPSFASTFTLIAPQSQVRRSAADSERESGVRSAPSPSSQPCIFVSTCRLLARRRSRIPASGIDHRAEIKLPRALTACSRKGSNNGNLNPVDSLARFAPQRVRDGWQRRLFPSAQLCRWPSAQGLICRWHPTSARCVSCGGEAHLWNGEGRRA